MTIDKVLISLADALDMHGIEKYADLVDDLIEQLSESGALEVSEEVIQPLSEKDNDDEDCDEGCDIEECEGCDDESCSCYKSEESYMSIQNLNKIEKMIQAIQAKVGDHAQFEDWLEDKISKITEDLQDVEDYLLNNEEFNEAEDLSEEDDSEKISTAAEYKGKKVTLSKPFRTPKGPKKFSVYVKNAKGNVVKVNFGSREMSIKRDQKSNRKSYRARHNCDNPGPKWKANYWSCKMWSTKPVSKIT
jgi:hypothetical protein